jgi:hypothetical protein
MRAHGGFWAGAGISLGLLVALVGWAAAAETIDMEGLNLLQTHARVLNAIDPPFLRIACTPPGGPTPDERFCVNDQPLFDPSKLMVRCPLGGCVVQIDLCLDYTLDGDGAIGVAFFRVAGAVPVPGPDAPVATLPSDATDTHHNRTCVTQFAAGLARGPHAVVVGAGVDNNFSGAAVGITVRSATAVIRVYR